MIVKALKPFVTYDATGRVMAREPGEVLDVQESTAERLLNMKLVTVPRKRKRQRSSEE